MFIYWGLDSQAKPVMFIRNVSCGNYATGLKVYNNLANKVYYTPLGGPSNQVESTLTFNKLILHYGDNEIRTMNEMIVNANALFTDDTEGAIDSWTVFKMAPVYGWTQTN